MDVRRYGVAAVLLLMPCSAYPSGHNFDAAAGFSYLRAHQNAAGTARSGIKSISGAEDDHIGVYGWHGVGALTFHGESDIWERLAVVGDVSGHFIQSGASGGLPDFQQITFLLGPRFEFPLFSKRASIMVHFLPLGFRLGNDDETAVVASGGVSFEGPTGIKGLGFRVVYDRLIIRGPLKGQGRGSFLLTHRFGHD